MPSCTAADLSPQLTPPPLLAAAGPQGAAPAACWREGYCEEVVNGRQRCPPGRCRAGGPEHAKIPCPDHERPFGREVAAEGGAPAGGAAAPRKKRSAPRRKPAAKRKAGTKRKAAARRRGPASSARGRKPRRAARKRAKRRR